MKELKLTNFNGTEVVDSRQVAEAVGKAHKNLLQDIRTYCEYLGELKIQLTDFFIESTYTTEQNKTMPCYLCTRKGCEMIANKLTGKKGITFTALYINAFHKMENQLKNENQKALPTTYKEALIQLLAQVEENEMLLEENQILTPKSKYHDEVLHKTGLISTTTIAKDLGMSGQKLNAILYLNKVIYKQGRSWKPFSKYEWLVSDGYADYQSYPNENAEPQLKWTERGRKWIIEHIDKWRQAC